MLLTGALLTRLRKLRTCLRRSSDDPPAVPEGAAAIVGPSRNKRSARTTTSVANKHTRVAAMHELAFICNTL
jgi:hypothetical protein